MGFINSIPDMLMFMLYLVGAYLFLSNAPAFNTMLNTAGNQWRATLTVLQAR